MWGNRQPRQIIEFLRAPPAAAAPAAAALAAAAVSPFDPALALVIVACGIAGAAALWTAAKTGVSTAGFAVAVVVIGALGGLERLVGGVLDAGIPGVSMRPLTAAALVVVGLALLCVATRRERAGRLLAVLPFLFAAGVLIGEFAGGSSRVSASVAIASLPNAALALLFGAVGLLVWPPSDDSRLRASVTWSCGVMSVLIALTALCGHLFDIEHMNSWSGVSLSLLAALGYGTLGIGLVSALPAAERRRSWMPVALGVAAIALGVTAWLYLLPREETRVSGMTRTVLDVAANQLRRELATTGDALLRLCERLESGLDEAAFRRDGANYLRDHAALAALTWRRGGDVWTLARNDEGSDAARRHMQTLAHHTRLARIAGRALLEQEWRVGDGTLVSAIAIDALTSRALAPVAAGYAIELRSGAQQWFSEGDTATERAQRASIRAGDEILTLVVAPKASVVGDSSSRQPEIVLFAGFVVAGVLVLALRLAGHAKESARTAERASVNLREEIDAHRRTGVALDDLRDNTDSVLATISDGFVAIDRAWRFRFVNRSAAQMLGLDAATIAGAPLETSGVLALYRDKLAGTIRDCRTADFEIVSHPPDRTIAVRAFAQQEGAALYLRDVSAEKAATRSLADSRALLAQAQRMAHLGSWHWFRDSGAMTWSDELYEIVGARAGATPSFDALVAATHPDDRAAVASAFAELIAGRGDLDLEYRLLLGDGTQRYVRSIAQADAAGTATLSGTLQDVSVARRRQEDLSAALARAEGQAIQLRAMRHVSLIASSKLGDADLLQVLVEEVREAIGAHIGRATLFAEAEGTASASIVSLSDKYADWRDQTAEAGFDRRPESSNAVLRLSEAEQAARAPLQAGRLPLRGLLSVPLRDRRGGVVGILDLSDRYDGDFTADDETVLMQFAQTFSIAIGWSKLIDALRSTRARLEKQLDEFSRSRALLAEAERVAQLGCWEIEVLPDGRRRRVWSEQTYRLFGLQPGAEPPDPDTVAPLVHADDRPRLAVAVAGAFERGEPFSLDFRITTGAGAVRWIHSEANVVRDAAGATARVFGTSQDVTEHKYVEQQTLARAEILRSVASGAPLVRTLTAIAELYELRFPEAACSVLLRDPRGRLYTAAAPNLPAEYSRLIDGVEIGPSAGSCGTAAWRRQQVIVGDIATDPLWVPWRDVALRFGLSACWSTPVLDKAGEVLATFAVYYGAPREPTREEFDKIADVVSIASIAIEAARSHARIADSEQRLRSLFAYVPEAVFAHDLDGRIVECNDTAVETSGYPREAIVTRGFADFVAPEHRDAAADCMRLALKGEVCRLEHEGVRPDGTRYNAATTTLPIVVGGATVGMYAISRDVTVQFQAQAELENALRTTTANNRELEEFAFVASHDLQEPLRKVRAFGERLRLHAGAALDVQSVDYVERMRAAAERMQRLIDDLLAYSRVSTRERCVTAVDLDRVLREALLDLETRIAETGAAVASDVLPVIEADATQMRQVLQNLIGNALKFKHPDRKPQVAVRAQFVRQSSAAAPDWLRIVVEDNGIGFDNRYRDRIFAPFQRLHGRNEYEGSGIGLAIVRRIVERHGGVLAADGDVGRGARFTIELPTRQSQPQAPNRAPEGKSA